MNENLVGVSAERGNTYQQYFSTRILSFVREGGGGWILIKQVIFEYIKMCYFKAKI